MKDDHVIDTLLHEIAHALVGHKHGHDAVWRRKALQIGCNGKRCYSEDSFKEEGKELLVKQSKYTLTCPTCKKQSAMHKRPKVNRSCSNCSNGRYNPIHKLEVTQNY